MAEKRKLVIPPEISEGIQKIAKEKQVTKQQLLQDLSKIMKEDDVVNKLDDDDARVQAAWGILASSYIDFGSKTETVIIQPLSVGTARAVKGGSNTVADLLAITHTDDGLMFSKYVGWGNVARSLETLNTETCYEIQARLKRTKYGITATVADDSEFRETDTELADITKFFADMRKDPNRRCTIADAPNNIVGKRDDLDIRVIKGTVVGATPTRNGTGAVYNIIDSTFTSSGNTSGFTVFGNLDQLKGGVGSQGYFAGKINVRDPTAEKPEVTMRNGIFAPIFTTDYVEE